MEYTYELIKELADEYIRVYCPIALQPAYKVALTARARSMNIIYAAPEGTPIEEMLHAVRIVAKRDGDRFVLKHYY
jgi:hypothetical protein